jgi:hypothetical protein
VVAVSVFEEAIRQVSADKAGPTGDEVTHAVRTENERGARLRSEARRSREKASL